ncbi:hypothetical protein IFM89_005341 [Coptis chinensis]|uniref:Uncharacterized protein n=1 Tax=Coptis chinensis TaxID=261450 RepID=A0A835LIB4_9MAGN|nr:hypothetical protein IFM89_005341 [Coptis chinensis]
MEEEKKKKKNKKKKNKQPPPHPDSKSTNGDATLSSVDHSDGMASLANRIKQLENDKEFSVLEENVLKETIAKMTIYQMEVQAQVKVLQESRDSLLQENQQLMETISYLQSQVQHLEDKCSLSAPSTTKTEKDKDATAQIEPASILVEKLITENAELVQKSSMAEQGIPSEHKVLERCICPLFPELRPEKDESLDFYNHLCPSHHTSIKVSPVPFQPQSHMIAKDQVLNPNNVDKDHVLYIDDHACLQFYDQVNELCIKFNQQCITAGRVSMKGLDPEVQETAIVDNGIPEFCEMSKLEEMVDFPASIQMKEKGIAVDHADSAPKKFEEINTEDYQEAGETEEIVQIPLNENEIREVEVQDANEVDVPITDAPLTGAPFRLISFFARYVSGADLVKNSNSSSGK